MTTVGAWLNLHPDLERLDREVLLCRAAGLTRAQVIARPEHILGKGAAETLETWAERRRRGEPVAYILGTKEFWGLDLEVSPAVLVPRPETELLVECAIQAVHARSSGPEPAQNQGEVRVLELGTGSGAIAIALAHEARQLDVSIGVTGTDVCPRALALAARNGRRHGVDARWLLSDWFAAVTGRFHLIVSNPPYVAENDPHLHLPNLRHEPSLALTAGSDGLDAMRAVIAASSGHLEPGGALMLEHGSDQAEAVRTLLAAAGFTALETLADLAGLDRVTRGRLAGGAP